MTEPRKLKRSTRVVLTTLTALTTSAVAACSDSGEWDSGPAAEGQVYATVSECIADSAYSDDECRDAYAQAQSDDSVTAPRFESVDLCEQEFGNGACQQRLAGNDGGGSFWTPLLAGFVIGEVLDEVGDASRRRRYGALYRNRGTGTWYHGGGAYGPLSRSSSGRYAFGGEAFNRAPTPRVQTRSSVVSRGGFGGRSRSSSSGGGWGG